MGLIHCQGTANSLVQRFFWGEGGGGEQGLGGNFVWCLIIVATFMGLGGAYRLREDFKVIISEASHKGMETFFFGGRGGS